MKLYFKILIYLILAIGVSIARADTPADLFKAIEIDAPHLVTRALVAGVDPNVRDGDGQAALYVALRSESWKAVEALLNHPGLQVDAANANGETPLMMAALRGQVPWMQRLVERGAAVNKAGWNPLHYAASGPSVQAVEWLLARGAAVDARSPNGSTALMMAARYGAIDATDLLLAKGANPALRNDRELSAADFARAAGRDTLAQRLQPR